VIAEALESRNAWETAASIPPPLVDSPKCTRCSLVGICLPEETHKLREDRPPPPPQLSLFDDAHNGRLKKQPARETRLLVTPRTDLRPLYLNSQGLYVGKTGAVLRVKEKDTVRQDVRIGELCQVNLMGNIQMSTQAVQELCSSEVPICYFSRGGWFWGSRQG
jgi:CRISPR-associated protein Cas1